ncbi:hypothetical protein [Parendozoicomonas haliclonae]|uniref:Uncharacterized protein n=1 Tax=Parendozoicomonas haliclonae TaxID=1960125 RepID=A0A1X7AP09_9GAMM|nr:hypothetical protein [Parendozoicomonas haliclonae]SMA49862.1 hypothetical protein EHSB41UT_03652 [Parendozoicomonas haliclonae]
MSGSINRPTGTQPSPSSLPPESQPKHLPDEEIQKTSLVESQEPKRSTRAVPDQPRQLPSNPNELPRRSPPELLSEADLLLTQADPLLNRTKDGRMVSYLGLAREKSGIEEHSDKQLNERTPRKHPSTSTSWFSPASWKLFRSKTTDERSVTLTDRTRLIDRQLLFRLLSFGLSFFAKGLSTYDLSGALKSLSNAYHKSRSGQPFQPEEIKLKSLTLSANNISLSNVTIKIKALEAVGEGEGEDAFKKLRIKASVTGQAAVKMGGGKEEDVEVNISDADLTLNFEKGTYLQRLLSTGSIYGNITALFMNLKAWRQNVIPQQIQCQVRNAEIQTVLKGTDAGRSAIKLNSADIIADFPTSAPSTTDGGNNPLHVQLQNVDAQVQTHNMEPLLPETHRQILSEVFPYTARGTNDIKVKSDLINITHDNGTLKVACPELKAESSGDITLKEGVIKGLTVATQSSSEMMPTPSVVAGEIQTGRTKTAIGFREASGDLCIPQSTFKQPYDITGPVKLGRGVVYIKAEHEGPRNALDVAFKIKDGEADLNGGIQAKGKAPTITGHVDVSRNITQISIPEVDAESFALSSRPDEVTDKSLLLQGGGTARDISIHVARTSDPTGEIETEIGIGQIDAHNTDGLLKAQSAKVRNASLKYKSVPSSPDDEETSPPGNDLALMRIKAEQVKLEGGELQKSITGESLDIKLDTATLHNCGVGYLMNTAPTTEVDQKEYTLSRKVEAWQTPQSKLSYTDLEVSVEELDAQTRIALPNASPDNETGAIPQVSGPLNIKQVGFSMGFDAEKGLDYVKTSFPKATLQITEGDTVGTVTGTAGNIVAWKGTESSPDALSTKIMFKELKGEGLNPSASYLPKHLSVGTDLSLGGIAIETSTQPPEKLSTKDANGDEQFTARPVQIKGIVNSTRLTSKLSMDDQAGQKAVETLTNTLEAARQHLPDNEKKQLDPLFKQLEEVKDRQDTAPSKPLSQTVSLGTGLLEFQSDTNKQGFQTSTVSTDNIEASLSQGPVKGHGQVKNAFYKTDKKTGTSSTEAIVEQVRIDELQSDTTRVPVTLELTRPAEINNIRVNLESFEEVSESHINVDSAQMQAQVGMAGQIEENGVTRPLKPMTLKTSAAQISSTAQNSSQQKLSTTTVGNLNLDIKDTQDQLGTDLDIKMTGNNLLVSQEITGSEEEQERRVTTELGSSAFSISGDLNGDARTGRLGVTVVKNQQGVRINPRYDAREIHTNFPNLAPELTRLLKHKQNVLQQSALGKLVDLQLNPNLDADLSGQISLSAGGALSPFIGMLVGYVENRLAKGALKAFSVLTKPINFRIHLTNLPVTNGRTTLAAVISCLSISFSSRTVALTPYAKIYQGVALAARSTVLMPVFKKLGLVDESTGEISVAKIFERIKPDIRLVSASEVPTIQVASAGDPLMDARNILQIGQTLPDNWNDDVYQQVVLQRIKTMRRQNQDLNEYTWTSKQERDVMLAKIQQDYPIPRTLAEFNNREAFFACLQEEIQTCRESVVLAEVYKNARDRVPPLIVSGTGTEMDATPEVAPTNIPKVRAGYEQGHTTYSRLDPDHIQSCMERIQTQLPHWIREPNSTSDRAQELIDKQRISNQRLLHSKSWLGVLNLLEKARLQSLDHEEKRKLWRACQHINREIHKILAPIAYSSGINPLDHMITPYK